jgi:hypothetical protein
MRFGRLIFINSHSWFRVIFDEYMKVWLPFRAGLEKWNFLRAASARELDRSTSAFSWQDIFQMGVMNCRFAVCLQIIPADGNRVFI